MGIELLAKIISVVTLTSIFMSALWIVRHYKNYTCPVYISTVLMVLIVPTFDFHLWHPNMNPDFYSIHAMVDLVFLCVSLTLARCGITAKQIRQYCCPHPKS